jgi:hypothetical protein
VHPEVAVRLDEPRQHPPPRRVHGADPLRHGDLGVGPHRGDLAADDEHGAAIDGLAVDGYDVSGSDRNIHES